MDAPITISHPCRGKILDPHLETGLIGTAGLVADGRPVGREHVASRPFGGTLTGLHIADQF